MRTQIEQFWGSGHEVLTMICNRAFEAASFHFADYDLDEIPSDVMEAWESCNVRWKNYLFESMPWFELLGRCNSKSATVRLMVVTNSQIGYVCFWPYAMQHFRTGGVMPITLCRSWSEDTRVGVSAVVSPELDETACVRIVGGCFDRLPVWNKMVIGLTRSPSPLLDALVGSLQARGLPFEQEIQAFSEIGGHATFNAFIRSLSRDWRRKYKRIVEKSIETGIIRIEHLDGSQTLQKLETIKRRVMDIYIETWKRQSVDRYANLARQEVFGPFSLFIETFAKRESLHVIFIKVHGDDAAFYLGAHFANQYCSVQTAYKEKYSSLSVGFLAQMENFRYTIERGFSTNNLLGNQSYKKHFTSKEVEFRNFVVHNKNIKGAAAHFLSRIKSRVERSRGGRENARTVRNANP
jgi:hypothetical protein